LIKCFVHVSAKTSKIGQSNKIDFCWLLKFQLISLLQSSREEVNYRPWCSFHENTKFHDKSCDNDRIEAGLSQSSQQSVKIVILIQILTRIFKSIVKGKLKKMIKIIVHLKQAKEVIFRRRHYTRQNEFCNAQPRIYIYYNYCTIYSDKIVS